MYYKGWIITLLFLATHSGAMAKSLPVPPSWTNLVEWQDTTKRPIEATERIQQERKTKKEESVLEKVEKSTVKVVPKAHNQQIPRSVMPKIKSVAPKVVVKTKINTKINIKL